MLNSAHDDELVMGRSVVELVAVFGNATVCVTILPESEVAIGGTETTPGVGRGS
jgi:hypothetical protein